MSLVTRLLVGGGGLVGEPGKKEQERAPDPTDSFKPRRLSKRALRERPRLVADTDMLGESETRVLPGLNPTGTTMSV